MKTAALALAMLLCAGTAQADPIKDLYDYLFWKPKRVIVPKEPAFNPIVPNNPHSAPPVKFKKPEVVPDTPKPKTAPAAPVKAKPKPIPKKVQEKPPGWVCAQIGFGLNTAGRATVISEGAKRGYSKSQTEQAIAACGY